MFCACWRNRTGGRWAWLPVGGFIILGQFVTHIDRRCLIINMFGDVSNWWSCDLSGHSLVRRGGCRGEFKNIEVGRTFVCWGGSISGDSINIVGKWQSALPHRVFFNPFLSQVPHLIHLTSLVTEISKVAICSASPGHSFFYWYLVTLSCPSSCFISHRPCHHCIMSFHKYFNQF